MRQRYKHPQKPPGGKPSSGPGTMMMPPQVKPKQTVTPDHYESIKRASQRTKKQDEEEALKIAKAMGYKPASDVVKEAQERGFAGAVAHENPEPGNRRPGYFGRAVERGVRMQRGDVAGAVSYLSDVLQTRFFERELARQKLRAATRTNRRGGLATRAAQKIANVGRRGILSTIPGFAGPLLGGATRPLAGAPRATRTGERAGGLSSRFSIGLNRSDARARAAASRAQEREHQRARVRELRERGRAQKVQAREKLKTERAKAKIAVTHQKDLRRAQVEKLRAQAKSKAAKQKLSKAAKKAAHNKKLHDKKVAEQAKQFSPLNQLLMAQNKTLGKRRTKVKNILTAVGPGLTAANAQGVAFPKTSGGATKSKKDCECKKPEKRPICKNPIIRVERDTENMTITRKLVCPRSKSKFPSVPQAPTPTSSPAAPSKSLVDVARSLLG